MYSINLIFVFLIAFTLGEECDKLGILIYEDIGCVPNEHDVNSCPSSYTCNDLVPKPGSCIYKGKSYKHGEAIDRNLSIRFCESECSCKADSEKSAFNCVLFFCASWGGQPPNLGCYHTHELDGCCEVSEKCAPFDNITVCDFDGKTYKENEPFYPKNTCLKCVCQKGFNGTLGKPFCKKTECGAQVHLSTSIQNFCAPVYALKAADSVLCCPDSFICPEGNEIIKGIIKSDETCKFGNKTLKIGQNFDKVDVTVVNTIYKKVTCECVIPPLLRCLPEI